MQLFPFFVVIIRMRKVLTIIIASIFLASGMKVSLGRHYCGGNLVDVKISVTGKLASCGMEQTGSDCPVHPAFGKKCCEDQISTYSLDSNYFPEYFKLSHPFSERDNLPVQIGHFLSDNLSNADPVNWVLPPGVYPKSALTLSEICVFRI